LKENKEQSSQPLSKNRNTSGKFIIAVGVNLFFIAMINISFADSPIIIAGELMIPFLFLVVGFYMVTRKKKPLI